MDNDFGMALIVVVVIAAFFIGGVVVGSHAGQDEVANLWCISLGYDSGEYDNDTDGVVCINVESIKENES